MAAKKFSLAELIAEGKVPELGTKPQRQIEYIDFDLIDSDPNNFYELSDLPQLASNIELFGLQQPLLVRTNPDDPSRVIIVSGHRRRAALQLLIDKESREDLRAVPCIREAQTGSDAFNKLMLIYANSDTRKMTAAEISKQAEEVEMLLYQLKEEGIEFPGRMRDHVAEACKVSKSKLARLKVIRENLSPDFFDAFERNTLPEQTAYLLAQLPMEFQQRLFRVASVKDLRGSYVEEIKRLYEGGTRWVCNMTCPNGKPCTHGDAALRHDLECYYEKCKGEKCCLTCEQATRSWSPCERMCSKAKAQRSAAKKAEDEKEAAERQKRTNSYQKKTRINAERLLRAINAAGVSDKVNIQWEYSGHTVAEIRKWAAGEFAEGSDWWGEKLQPEKCQHPIDIAKKLGCSADFILGLTDELKPAGAATSECAGVAWYPASVEPKSGTEVVVIDDLGCADNGKYFSGGSFDGSVLWKEVVLWTPAPGSGVLDLPAAVPPAEGWVPLAWTPGMERPEKDGQRAVGKFMAPGMDKPLERIVVWDEFTRQWKFPNGAGTVECECVGWFPIPEDG